MRKPSAQAFPDCFFTFGLVCVAMFPSLREPPCSCQLIPMGSVMCEISVHVSCEREHMCIHVYADRQAAALMVKPRSCLGLVGVLGNGDCLRKNFDWLSNVVGNSNFSRG